MASGFGKRRKLIILIYHRVFAKPDFMCPEQIDSAKFDWQMALLASHFNVLSLSEALQQLKNGHLPSRAVCITFDDGYADNYTTALPILQRYGLSATFFVVSGMLNQSRMWSDDIVETIRLYPGAVLDLNALGFGAYAVSTVTEKAQAAAQIITQVKYLPLGERDAICRSIADLVDQPLLQLMLTTEQLNDLSAQGMEIGAHSVNHPILKNLPCEQWQYEILNCKLQLEAVLGKTVRYFAYPNGKLHDDYDREQCQFVEQCGYEAALSTEWGRVSRESDWFQLPRFTPWDHTPARFMLRMANEYF